MSEYDRLDRQNQRPAAPVPLVRGAETGLASGLQPLTPGVRLKRYAAVVARYRWVALGVALAVLGATAYKIHTATPMFSAVATVRLVEDDMGAAMSGMQGVMMRQVLGKTNNLMTEVHVLKSRPMLAEVVDSSGYRLRFATEGLNSSLLDRIRVSGDAAPRKLPVAFTDAGYTVRDGTESVTAAYGEMARLRGVEFTIVARPEQVTQAELEVIPRAAAVGEMSYLLSARPRPSTEILDLEFTSADPAVAQRVANAAADVYRNFDARKKRGDAERRRRFIEEQLAYVDSLQRAAQASLGAFREREKTFSSKAQLEAVQGGILELESKREGLESSRQMYRRLLASLQRGEGSSDREVQAVLSTPEVVGSPVISQLFSQLSQYEVSRDTLVASGRASSDRDVQRQTTLIRNLETRLVGALQSLIESVSARIDMLDRLIAEKGQSVENFTGPEAQELRLLQQVELLGAMAVKLGEEFQQARIAEAIERGDVEVVEYALLPQRPVGTSTSIKLVIGIVLALVGAVGSAIVLDNLNTSITRREDLPHSLRLADLAVIPQMPVLESGFRRMRLPGRVVGNGPRANGNTLVAVSNNYSPSAEAYRELRTRLMFSDAATAKRIVVTSAAPAEGKTTTAANLAATYVQQGLRVLIVDCDLRRPRLHEVFHVSGHPGVGEVVEGSSTLAAAMRATSVPGLFVLPSGRSARNPSELLGSAEMQALLEEASQSFDLVVLDTPPVLAVSDAAVLGARADGVLFVVRAGQTDREEAQLAVQKLVSVGAHIIGGVLNDPDARAPHFPSYYSYAKA